jgi:hypothetical protein
MVFGQTLTTQPSNRRRLPRRYFAVSASSRMPGFFREVHLVGNRSDDHKLCSERSAVFAQRTKIRELGGRELRH